MSYQVRPEDVVVLDRSGRPPEPPQRGVTAWLRRFRLRIALGIAVVESVLFVFTDVSDVALLALGIGVVALHLTYGRNLRSPLLRQVSWIAAFSQGLVAVIPAAVGLTVFALVVIGTVALLILLMLLLGERSR